MKTIAKASFNYSSKLASEAIISKEENTGFYQINVKYMSGVEDVKHINFRAPFDIIRFLFSSSELQLVGDELLKDLFNRNFIKLSEKYNDFAGFKSLMRTHNCYVATFIEIYTQMNMKLANDILVDMLEGGN